MPRYFNGNIKRLRHGKKERERDREENHRHTSLTLLRCCERVCVWQSGCAMPFAIHLVSIARSFRTEKQWKEHAIYVPMKNEILRRRRRWWRRRRWLLQHLRRRQRHRMICERMNEKVFKCEMWMHVPRHTGAHTQLFSTFFHRSLARSVVDVFGPLFLCTQRVGKIWPTTELKWKSPGTG